MRNKRFALLLALLFLFSFVMPAAVAAAGLPQHGAFYTVREQEAEAIGEGVTLLSYTLAAGDRPVRVCILQIDLTNPYVKLDALIGADGTQAKTETVSRMIAGRSGAVAAVNGGFFIMSKGKPLGTLIRDGELAAGPIRRNDMPVFALSKDKRPLFDFFSFSGETRAGNGAVFPLYGVNKPAYDLEDGSLSDTDHLTLYDRYWGPLSRGADPNHPGALVAEVDEGTVKRVVYAGEEQFPIPAGGYALWGHGAAADFIRQSLPVGASVYVSYRTEPDFKKMMLSTGSNSFLVREGKVAAFEEELKGQTARTAVASAGNGRWLYLAAVEKSDASAGMEQSELARLLVDLGAEEALNLDGGGSTTLVARHLGNFDLSLLNRPKEGRERRVTDGIGIFNTAPAGQPAGLIISGPPTVLSGTYAEYTVKGYDSHYHPWQPEGVKWSLPAGAGDFVGNTFYPLRSGEFTLTAVAGTARGEKKVRVLGSGDLKSLRVEPAMIRADIAQAIPLTFTVETIDGRLIPLEAKYVEGRSTLGEFRGGQFYTGTVRGGDKLKVSFLNLAVEIPVQVGSLFRDTGSSWAFKQIEEVAAAGILKGFEDGAFRPAELVTRAQVVTILSRLLNWPPAQTQPSFKDEVPDWAKNAVASAVKRNVVKGYPDGRFLPGYYITRAELCAILDRALKISPGREEMDFSDTNAVPAWAGDAMDRVVSAGLIRGYEDGSLRPGANVTRAEMAVIISRYRDGSLSRL
ncbi:MAG: hypothetical protein C4589_04935 [Peptococcaceae bacterium]|nr:MAG: hypothetical protein C4589_04935 [Peptococcaceae bacterium]